MENIEKEKKQDASSTWEKQIRLQLDRIWENRHMLEQSDYKNLIRMANKSNFYGRK